MSESSVASVVGMAEEDFLSEFDKMEQELKAKFTKGYSVSRLEQILSHFATCRMLVSCIHDEAVREEDSARKDSVLQRMVLDGRNMTEARDAVERGER